jgi:Protein of unknown function (DUF1207)
MGHVWRSVSFSAAIPLAAFLLGPASAPALGAERASETGLPHLDCRYPADSPAVPTSGEEAPGPAESVLLPDNDVFRPLLADQREARFYADYRWIRFKNSSNVLSEGQGRYISAALVGFGGAFGIWGMRQPHGCDGLQLSLFGAVFAQFNLDTPSFDLLNADYLVGPELTFRRGRWSGRVRLYHQSSHLGDEFLLNYGIAHGVQRQDLSFEIADAFVSVEDAWWRVYLGAGLVVLSSSQPDLASTPAFLQWGFELRGPVWAWLNRTSLRPVLGGNFSSVQATSWTPSASVNAGLEWASPRGAHRARVLLEYQRASMPFSQFFFERTQNFGAQLQFEF